MSFNCLYSLIANSTYNVLAYVTICRESNCSFHMCSSLYNGIKIPMEYNRYSMEGQAFLDFYRNDNIANTQQHGELGGIILIRKVS